MSKGVILRVIFLSAVLTISTACTYSDDTAISVGQDLCNKVAGTWKGIQDYPEFNESESWISIYNQDGSSSAKFTVQSGGKYSDSDEVGTWSCDKNILVTNQGELGEPKSRMEYKLINVDQKEMRYRPTDPDLSYLEFVSYK